MYPSWIVVIILTFGLINCDNKSDDVPQIHVNNNLLFLDSGKTFTLSCEDEKSFPLKSFTWYRKSTEGHWVHLSSAKFNPTLTINKNGIYKCRIVYNGGFVKETRFVVKNLNHRKLRSVSSLTGQSATDNLLTTTPVSDISTGNDVTASSITETQQNSNKFPQTTPYFIDNSSNTEGILNVTETTTGASEPSNKLGIWSIVGIAATSVVVIGAIILTFYLLYRRRLICSDREPANFPRVEITHSQRTLSRTSTDLLPSSARSSNRRPRGGSNASSGSGEYMYNNFAAELSDTPGTELPNRLSLFPPENPSPETPKYSEQTFEPPLDDSVLTDELQFQPGKLSLLV